jgi:hypothetical protein
VRLHLVDYPSGFFRSANVTLVAPNGETLARVRIKKGDRVATVKDDDEFAEYCADAISDVILNRPSLFSLGAK